MPDKIKFPLDSSAYLRKAHHLYKKEQNKKALKYIKKAYEIDNDFQINFFYVLMLSHFEKNKEALEIMSQQKESYMSNEKHANFYAEILIKEQKFVEAEYVIQKFKQDEETEDKQLWQNLESSLIEERKKVNLQIQAQRSKIKNSLRELDQHSQMMQVKKVRDAEILTLSELQEIAPMILINTGISGTVQRYFLELLIQKGDHNVYSFVWFNQIKKICPATLSTFNDIQLVHDMTHLVEKKLAKYPDLKMRVKVEMMHDLLLLYPYINETIKEVNFWVEAYISELDFFNYLEIKQKAVNKEQREMLEWIDYLNIVAQREKMSEKE